MSAPRVVAIAAGSHIFGAAHAPALAAEGADVVGLYDVNRLAAAAVGEARGWPVIDDLDTLLGLGADAAVIAAPHPLHAQLAERALLAGLHVLVEKPLAARPSEARAMVDAADRAGRVLAVALQHRFRLEVIRARQVIRSGELGRLSRIDVVSTYPKRSAYYETAPWRGTWAGEGGGVLLNQGQHDLDTLVHIVGMPERVVGWTRTRVLPIETEDTVSAMLEWADGAIGTVRVSSAESDPPNRIEIIGTAGAVRITPGALEHARFAEDFRDFAAAPGGPFDPFERGPFERLPGGGGTHADIYRDFFAAIAEGRQPIAPAATAIPALDLTAAIVLSSSEGRQLELPLDVVAYDRMLDRHMTREPEPAAREGAR